MHALAEGRRPNEDSCADLDTAESQLRFYSYSAQQARRSAERVFEEKNKMSTIAKMVKVSKRLFLAVYVSRGKLKPQFPALGSQRMCPNCGRITSRSKAACLECGKALTA
jgi:hypothetical protein